ncbi:MAG: hypothetical protein ACLR2G_06565 [Phascolarctobacterium faecium]
MLMAISFGDPQKLKPGERNESLISWAGGRGEQLKLGAGVICFDDLLPIDARNWYIPAGLL